MQLYLLGLLRLLPINRRLHGLLSDAFYAFQNVLPNKLPPRCFQCHLGGVVS
jgi:hypothetical protein